MKKLSSVHEFNMKNVFRFFVLQLIIITLASANFNIALAIGITGPSRICPGASATFTVNDLPAGTQRWSYSFHDPGLAPETFRYPTDSKTISYTFANTGGSAYVWIKAYGTPAGQTLISQQSLTISKSGPNPYAPNNGLVIGCSANEEVAISSSPFLQNNAADCFFHCGYNWSAPSGWNLKRVGATGNPLLAATNVVFPSGLSNGNVGNITVTALYSQCGASANTSTSATLWYGTPIVSNPQVNGSPNQSFNVIPSGWANLTVSGQGASSYSWTIEGGSGTLSPNATSCQVSFSNFVRVVVTPSNRCGLSTTSRQTFYLSKTSSGGFMVYPNPATDNLSIQFNDSETASYIFESATLYDDKDQVVRQFGLQKENDEAHAYFKTQKTIEWDIRKLPKGTYFVHVKMGSEITKSKVMIE